MIRLYSIDLASQTWVLRGGCSFSVFCFLFSFSLSFFCLPSLSPFPSLFLPLLSKGDMPGCSVMENELALVVVVRSFVVGKSKGRSRCVSSIVAGYCISCVCTVVSIVSRTVVVVVVPVPPFYDSLCVSVSSFGLGRLGRKRERVRIDEDDDEKDGSRWPLLSFAHSSLIC